MGQCQITAKDGFTLGAYEAQPDNPAKAGVVVIQEIFGVNSHIREVVDGYAAHGYYAIAPQIFDRVEANIELGYTEADTGRGIELAFQRLDRASTLLDLQAAIDQAGGVDAGGQKPGKVGVVGYCFGGLLCWLGACQLTGVSAASVYYGGGIVGELQRKAGCPVMMHFGDLDAHIPLSDVEKIKAALPTAEVFVYAADHGFNCSQRGSYNAAAASTARDRTLAFFASNLA
jgi:carboxymethylenebutenolidase